MQQTSTFQQKWHNANEILRYVAKQVNNYYCFERKEPFKLNSSVIPAYTVVYNLCTQKPSYKQIVFDKYKDALRQFIRDNANRNTNPIQQFNILWESFTMYMLTISKRIFSYLDRYFTPATQAGSLTKIGMNLFRQQYLITSKKQYYFNNYVQQLGQIRDKRIISTKSLLMFTQAIAVMDHTKLLIELVDIFLKESEEFYNYVHSKHANQMCSQYLQTINNLIYFEQMVYKQLICLNPNQINAVNTIFESFLIKPFTNKLLTDRNGLKLFLQSSSLHMLRLINRTYEKYEGFTLIKNGIYEFICQKGQAILDRLNNKDQKIVTMKSFYQFYLEYSDLIMLGFANQKEIEISFKNGIEKQLSRKQVIVQCFFEFVRKSLDKGQFDANQQFIKGFFEILPSKDEFISLYARSVEQKILNGSFIYLIQKNFITVLISMVGSEACIKIQKKIEDYVEPLQIIAGYKEQDFRFTVKVMGIHLWQKKFDEQITFNLSLYEPFGKYWQKFSEFYMKAYQKKKLILLPFQNKLEIEIKFKKTMIKVKCNLLQAILIYFISQKDRSQTEISSILTIEKGIFYKFFETAPPFIKQKSEGLFSFDWNFDSQQVFFNLHEKALEQQKIPKAMKEDRDILLQASITKLLKHEKQMNFEQIATEICQRIKLFKPQPASIKNSIQRLIKKEILEQEGTGLIKYVQ